MGFINPEHHRSPEWETFRHAVIAEHGRFCAHCDQRTADPYVQPMAIYFIPERLPWEYELDEMQVVCRDCYYEADKLGTNFLRIMGQFTGDEQMLLVKVVKRICDADSSARQTMTERMRQLLNREINAPELDQEELKREKQKTQAALMSFNTSTIEPLLESLLLLQRKPLSQRQQLILKLQTAHLLAEEEEHNRYDYEDY